MPFVRPSKAQISRAYAQTDQRICMLPEYSLIVKLLTEHHLEFLSLKNVAQARLSLQLSKYHIAGHLMSWFIIINNYCDEDGDFITSEKAVCLTYGFGVLTKNVSEYDQEIPQSPFKLRN